MNERVDLSLLKPVMNPSNDNDGISLDENPLDMQLLYGLNDAHQRSNSELSIWN